MPDDEAQVERIVQSSILEAIKARVANLNVVARLADATDMYGKNTPGDAYAKNQALEVIKDLTVLPPEIQVPVVKSE